MINGDTLGELYSKIKSKIPGQDKEDEAPKITMAQKIQSEFSDGKSQVEEEKKEEE